MAAIPATTLPAVALPAATEPARHVCRELRLRLIVATDHRFIRAPDGLVRATDASGSWEFWSRYLDVFDDVLVVARVFAGDSDGLLVAGAGVRVLPVQPYEGWLGYVRALPALRAQLLHLIDRPDGAYIVRAPGLIATTLSQLLSARRIAFGLEIAGDPWEVVRSGGVLPRGGAVLAPLAGAMLRRQARQAAAVTYVTRDTLQRSYPATPTTYVGWASNVRLDDTDFAAGPRPLASLQGRPARLLAIGSQARRYKGHDVLLAALEILASWGIVAELTLVGSGRHHKDLVQSATKRRLTHAVRFIPGIERRAAVFAEMDRTDVFVLPSRTEGLPRVLVEAMARAAPAVASDVGGVRELLATEDRVPPGRPLPLADLLATVLRDDARRVRMSARNLRTAQDYRHATLAARGAEYRRAVREVSHSTATSRR